MMVSSVCRESENQILDILFLQLLTSVLNISGETVYSSLCFYVFCVMMASILNSTFHPFTIPNQLCMFPLENVDVSCTVEDSQHAAQK